ncbi:MAG: ATP-binding protein, partial [Thermoleophilia bacterium]|nr:ATP-binding protein [Thermoleophilia bacterium]
LVLARAQRRTEAARLEVVELCSLLGDVVAELRTAPGVDVQLRCEPHVAALANRDLTEQAVANLVANAARYTARGRIDVIADRLGDDVVISIADTGRGMTSEELARASERFYQGDERDAEGFGLGLSIARQAIEAMGGRLALESRRGGGTTATVRLAGATLVEP